jgi:predicted small lipoprotein YifL
MQRFVTLLALAALTACAQKEPPAPVAQTQTQPAQESSQACQPASTRWITRTPR